MAETYVAYVDDSGDSRSFALGALLIPATQWLTVHDQLRDFRNRLSTQTGFRMRRELHATELVGNGGGWRRLTVEPRRRFGIYRAAFRELAAMGSVVRTVAVVVPNRDDTRLSAPAQREAWSVLLERFRTFCFYKSATCVVLPDEGYSATVRRLARKHRRFGYAPAAFGGAARPVPFSQLVDNPLHQPSHESYPLQWADLVAYAAFRAVVPRATVPNNLWNDLGPSALGEANEIEREHKNSAERPGLIVWPSRLKPGVPL